MIIYMIQLVIVSVKLYREYPQTFLTTLIVLYIHLSVWIYRYVGRYQDNRTTGWQIHNHVYVYICLIASMPIYLSYRVYHIYSFVYTMICMDIKK